MTLKIVSTPEEMLMAYAVRNIVFVAEQKCPYQLEFDEFNYSAILIVGVDDAGEPYAAGRIRPVNGYAKLERTPSTNRFAAGPSSPS